MSRRGTSARTFAVLALLATAVLSASCGTQGNDTLGVGLIEDRGLLKAVRLISVTPDTSASYQVLSVPADVPSATTLLVSARPGYLARSLMQFPSASLPPAGTVVDSATLALPYTEGFATSPFSMTLHRVTVGWTESVIAPEAFPAFDAAIDSADVPFADPLLDTLSLTTTALRSLVQSWVADSTTNFGIALAPAAGEDAELQLASAQSGTPPRLTVHWTVSGRDTSASVTPSRDTFSLGTTSSFVPLDQEPRRLTVARGLPARSLVRFSWPDLGPRATVHRAELTLHLDVARSSGRIVPCGVRRITAEPWSGADTPVDAAFHGIASVSATQDSALFDVTNVLEQLLSAENHGFEIRAVDEKSNTSYLRFHAHDTEEPAKAPRLQIWYTPGDVPEDRP